jgi:hypothetical protein
MLTTDDVNIHALIAKYGIDIQIMRPEMTKFKMFRVKVILANNKTLNARSLARVITGCHYTQWSSRRDLLRSLTEFLTPAFINNKT